MHAEWMIGFQRRGIRVEYNGHQWLWYDGYGWVNEEDDAAWIYEHVEIDCLVFPRQAERIRRKAETAIASERYTSEQNVKILLGHFDGKTLDFDSLL